MDGDGSISSKVNVLVEEVVSKKGAVYPNVYIFGYDHEGKEEVNEYLESIAQDTSKPNFAVNLVEGYMTRSAISKELYIALEKIRKNSETEDTPIAFLMVMNPNIHSKSSRDKAVVTQLLKEIGSEILRRCVLVLVKGDELLRKTTKLKNHYNDVVGKQWCMCDLYEQTYPWIIAIDIKGTPPSVKIGQGDQLLSLLLATGARFDKSVGNYWKKGAKAVTILFLSFAIGFGIGLLFYRFVFKI